MSTKELFKERKRYDKAVPMDFFNQNFIEFITLNRYAVVDTKNNLIIPREAKLKPLAGTDKLEVLSFVSLAYEGFMKDLQHRISEGGWETDSIFTEIKPATAFTSPIQAFDDFMTKQFQAITPLLYKNRDVKDFVTFLDVFQNHLASVKNNFDYTFTGFLESSNNMQHTGLQIEFIKEEKNDINLKAIYILDPAFKRYLLLAEKHGFYVNRNSPWSLVANIDSPAMQIYASQDAGINIGTQGILKRYFQPAINLSFDFFVNYLIGTYNAVAGDEPTYSYLVPVQDDCRGYKKIIIERSTLDTKEDISEESMNILELIYLQMRYYETFSLPQGLKNVLRQYREEKKVKRYPFSDLVERLVGPAKNSSLLFYSVTGQTTVISYEFSFQASEAAAKLGSSGAHKMPNGRWMPCANHEEYISLTSA